MTVRRYRKKPVEITAIEYTGDYASSQEIKAWLKDSETPAYRDFSGELGKPFVFKIRTLEGDHTVTPGDYVIRGVHAEAYPCKPDIFAKTYERACL